MNKCPTVHKHPIFSSSFDPANTRQAYEVNKIEKYLKDGQKIGDYKSADLRPLVGFPREEAAKGLRIFYVLCADCDKKLFVTPCPFCGTAEHTMDDAVFFDMDSDHKKAYKNVKKNFNNLKNENWVQPHSN